MKTRAGSMRTSIMVATESLRHFEAAMRRAAEAVARWSVAQEAELRELRRADWWKRGEKPPEFESDIEELEWWQRGEEPPEFDAE